MTQQRQRRITERVYEHRARWSARRLRPWIRERDRVLDYGAGDCRVDLILQQRAKCEVVPVDVEDFNRTPLALTLYDGQRLPFEDHSFDVVLLLFVLHHAEDARAVLREAGRVCRRHIIAFEDVNQTWWDRTVFRGFHRWLAWSQKISRPHHELSPDQWVQLAADEGFATHSREPLGRQLGPFASRHVAFIWERAGDGAASDPPQGGDV